MPRKVCKTDSDLFSVSRLLFSMGGDYETKYPLTVSWKKGDDRSDRQNALSHKWYTEIAMQSGDQDTSDVRAECKLNIGVRMLHAENEDFRADWNRLYRGRFTYEELLEIMVPPSDYPVTRIMTTKQMQRYLDKVYDKYSAQGMTLTLPPVDQPERG